MSLLSLFPFYFLLCLVNILSLGTLINCHRLSVVLNCTLLTFDHLWLVCGVWLHYRTFLLGSLLSKCNLCKLLLALGSGGMLHFCQVYGHKALIVLSESLIFNFFADKGFSKKISLQSGPKGHYGAVAVRRASHESAVGAHPGQIINRGVVDISNHGQRHSTVGAVDDDLICGGHSKN